MKRIAVPFLICLTMTIISIYDGTASAAEKKSCKSCSYSCIIIPMYVAMPVVFSLYSPDGPLEYAKVNQIVPGDPVNRYKFWCMCMDDEGQTGPNPEPEFRWCQVYSKIIPGSGPNEDYVEGDYCEWTGTPSETTCGSSGTPCPWL